MELGKRSGFYVVTKLIGLCKSILSDSYITFQAVQREGEHRKSNVPHKLDFLRLYITQQYLGNFIRNSPHCFDV